MPTHMLLGFSVTAEIKEKGHYSYEIRVISSQLVHTVFLNFITSVNFA
jgi:hypothetical protein